jgi:hypothetical protein
MNLFKKTTVKNVLDNTQYNFVNGANVVENLVYVILYIRKHEIIKEIDIENVIKEFDLKSAISANGKDYTCNCIEYDLIAYQAIEQ